MQMLHANSGTDKLAAAEVAACEYCTEIPELANQQRKVAACKHGAEIPELANWQQKVGACKCCAEIAVQTN